MPQFLNDEPLMEVMETETRQRVGIARGKYILPDDIDECNDEIAVLFGVDEIKVISVKPLKDRKILLTFNTGERRLYDTRRLKGSVFNKLDDEYIFMNPMIFKGIVTWNEGEIDIAPETVYEDGIPYQDDIIL